MERPWRYGGQLETTRTRDGPRLRRYGRSQRRPPVVGTRVSRGCEHPPKVAIRWSHTSKAKRCCFVHALFRIEPPGSISRVPVSSSSSVRGGGFLGGRVVGEVAVPATPQLTTPAGRSEPGHPLEMLTSDDQRPIARYRAVGVAPNMAPRSGVLGYGWISPCRRTHPPSWSWRKRVRTALVAPWASAAAGIGMTSRGCVHGLASSPPCHPCKQA